MLDKLREDLRDATRVLRKDRGFAVATVATLALCLAANAGIFTIVNALLLRPLPYTEPDRLVTMFNAYPAAGAVRGANAVPDYFDRLQHTDVFDDVALYTWTNVTLGGQGSGDAERISGMTVTPSFFHVLRVQPVRGRLFAERDTEVGQHRTVILSEGLKDRLFPGRKDAQGSDLRLNGEIYTVVGVMPASFRFDPDSQIWMPAAFSPEDRADSRRHSNNWQMMARLRPGATLVQAQAQIDALNARNLERFPEMKQVLVNAGFHTPVFLLQDDLVRDTRPIMLLLWGGALLVLVIGCVNVANLAAIRASGRARDMATRLSLGTTTGRLVQRAVTESLVLSAVGGASGLLLARWTLEGIAALGLEAFRGKEISLDAQTVAYTILLVTSVGGVIGGWPMLSLRRISLIEVIRDEGRSGTPSRRARMMRRVLVTSQVAFALILLMGAGLLVASFERMLAVDLGFHPGNVLTGDITLPVSRYAGQPDTRPPGAAPVSVQTAADRILAEVRGLPGVTAAGMTTSIPFGRNYSDSVILAEGYQLTPEESLISPSQVRVSDGYFEAMGATLVAGRFFDARDMRTAPRTVIVDESLARTFWRDADPIGRRMYFPRGVETGLAPPPENEWLTVVGVVKEMRLQGIASNAGSGLFGAYFLPFRQFPERAVTLAIRSEQEPASISGSVRAAISRIDAELAFYDVRPMDALVDRVLMERRTPLLLVIGFAVAALILSAIGIYGVLAYDVRQRTREIAIRIALGAGRGRIIGMVLREAGLIVTTGALLGAGGSFFLRQFVESQLFQVGVLDPTVVGSVAAVLLVVATLACGLPARRAVLTNPTNALAE